MNGRPVRVAHLVSHPIQYFAPLYRELATRAEIDLTVYFYSDASVEQFIDPEFGRPIRWGVDLLSGFNSRFLPSATGTPLGASPTTVHHDIIRELSNERYDLIWAHGYSHATAWLAARAAARTGSTFAIREEQTLLHPRPRAKRAAKRVALSWLFRRSVGLYIGTLNRAYLEHYGIPDERLFWAPYSVDNAGLRSMDAALRPRRRQLRLELGLDPDKPVVLFVGKLTENKQPLRLMEAFALARRRVDAQLVIVGDGLLRAELERVGRPDVHMLGFMDQASLPRAYVVADLLVLPSVRETWGLVVNEALNFALPVITTHGVGCAPDLVRKDNGIAVAHDDTDAFAAAIVELVDDAARRRAMGEAGKRLVERYSVARTADGIVAAALAQRADERVAA